MDLRFLQDVTRTAQPVATVYLDASHDTEDAARALELRWSEHRGTLAEEGADEATLDALAAAVTEGVPAVSRAGRVLVACDGAVLLDRLLPEPPARPTARWGPVADLLPMLLDRPEPVSTVVVRIDETGGEILVSAPGSDPRPVEEVDGGDSPVHKVRAGGLSHLNMQERVEESWRRNTAAVADRVDSHVAATGARLLVLAGDARSRARLLDALNERSAGVAVEVEHSGGATGDDLAAAVALAVRDHATNERLAVLDRYDKVAGRAEGLAVEGVDAVLAALRAEAVDTLLIDGTVTRDAQVWISEIPTQLATSAEDLRAVGTEPTAQAPVDGALLRAAAGAGADFVPIGGGSTGLAGRPIADGVAALLRYPVPTGG